MTNCLVITTLFTSFSFFTLSDLGSTWIGGEGVKVWEWSIVSLALDLCILLQVQLGASLKDLSLLCAHHLFPIFSCLSSDAHTGRTARHPDRYSNEWNCGGHSVIIYQSTPQNNQNQETVTLSWNLCSGGETRVFVVILRNSAEIVQTNGLEKKFYSNLDRLLSEIRYQTDKRLSISVHRNECKFPD